MADVLIRFHIIEILIGLWGIATAWLFWMTWKTARSLHDDLVVRERRANPKEQKDKPLTEEQVRAHEDQVDKKRSRMNLFYALFSNFTSVFPLWGMLGTVVALLALAGKMTGDEVPVDQFFGALTTTAAGIVFAIIFKSLDSVVSVKVDANNHEVETLFHRNSKRFGDRRPLPERSGQS